MKVSGDKSTSTRISIARIKPYRLTGGVFEIRWRDGKRRCSVLLAPRNPLRPTELEIIEAVRSAYPVERRPDVIVPDRAWASARPR